MPSLDGKELTQILKMASKKKFHYVFAPGKTLEQSFIALDKKKLPPEVLKEAKDQTASKPIRGTCTVEDGEVFVFETDKPYSNKHLKALKLLMKKRAKLPKYEVEIRGDKEEDEEDDGGKTPGKKAGSGAARSPEEKAAKEKRKKERVTKFGEINKEIDRLMKSIG